MIYKTLKRKFTLIEMLAVISIIAILLALSVGVYSLVMTKMSNTRTQALLKKVEMAMCAYKNETGYYFQQGSLGPLTINSSDTDFIQFLNWTSMKNKGEINENNGYRLTDAWGKVILYQAPGSNNTTMFDLQSFGKDRVSGGGDDITNYSN